MLFVIVSHFRCICVVGASICLHESVWCTLVSASRVLRAGPQELYRTYRVRLRICFGISRRRPRQSIGRNAMSIRVHFIRLSLCNGKRSSQRCGDSSCSDKDEVIRVGIRYNERKMPSFKVPFIFCWTTSRTDSALLAFHDLCYRVSHNDASG